MTMIVLKIYRSLISANSYSATAHPQFPFKRMSVAKNFYHHSVYCFSMFLVASARRVGEAIDSGENKWSDLDDGSYSPTACIIAGANSVEDSESTPEVLEALLTSKAQRTTTKFESSS